MRNTLFLYVIVFQWTIRVLSMVSRPNLLVFLMGHHATNSLLQNHWSRRLMVSMINQTEHICLAVLCSYMDHFSRYSSPELRFAVTHRPHDQNGWFLRYSRQIRDHNRFQKGSYLIKIDLTWMINYRRNVVAINFGWQFVDDESQNLVYNLRFIKCEKDPLCQI